MSIVVPSSVALQVSLAYADRAHKSNLSLVVEQEASQQADEELYQRAGWSAKRLGLLHLLLGKHLLAKDLLKQSSGFLQRAAEVVTPSSLNYPPMRLEQTEIAIMSLDDAAASKAANESDWQPKSSTWLGINGPWYYLAQAEAGMVLRWDDSRMGEIASATRGKRLPVNVDAALSTIWAVRRKRVSEVAKHIARLARWHQQDSRANSDAPDAVIYVRSTALLILALRDGMDLGHLDPPFVPMDYVRLANQ